ncbi:MAG TPA: galactitol-1-phosphate 5-dehydrogenase [Bryobacteraceae bacterium]|nr:galactitol-1-phosphate 5-dehydrogenase [Bryobacteraceae bacterium]
MKALLLTEYKKLELTDLPVPEIAPDEVLIRVKACGICGSDVHGFDGSTGRRIPPVVMGHEASGVIEKAGSAVRGLAEGDRVAFDSMVSCGKCAFCRTGRVNLCDNRQVLGVSCGEYRRNGAFAEYVAVPQHIVYKLPDTLSFEHAAMIEPVSVALHAVEITPIHLGDTAVVVGSGMIGALTIQAAKLAGCVRVIAIDLEDHKLEMARKSGATDVVNGRTTDPVQYVLEATGGRGADVAFEAVGATEPVRTALRSVRKGGTVTLIGNIRPEIELNLQSVVTREIRLQGSCASSGEYPQCIALMGAGAFNVAPMLTAKAPLEEGARWFERLYSHEPNLMKIVLEP